MPLNPQTLADALAKIGLKGNEPEAAAAWADAWFEYLSGAQALVAGAPVPVAKPALLSFKPIMITALLGMSVPGAGPQKIQDGITAVWTAMVAGTATVFPGPIPPLFPPAGISGIAAAILSVAGANTSGRVTQDAALRNIANAIHPLQLGGLVTYPFVPSPLTGPIT